MGPSFLEGGPIMCWSCPSVRLSVCPSVSVCPVPPPREKMKRPTNTKLGRKGPWDTSTPWTNFKVKGSKVKVTAANCVVGKKSTTTKALSPCSVVKSKWFTRWQHLLSPCGSTHVGLLNCKDGPIAGSPSTAAHSCLEIITNYTSFWSLAHIALSLATES